MLQAIHDRVTGIIAWIIVGAVSVTFALWGINWYLKGDTKIYAAKVNDVEISVNDYRFGYRQQLNRMQAMLGDRFDRSKFSTPEFKTAVLNRLVEEELLVQAAHEAGMAISDGLLAATIHADPSFQDNGEFSADKYKRMLSQQGLSPALYEQRLRRSLLINQYIKAISDSTVVTDQEVDRDLQLQFQKRDVALLTVPMQAFMDKAEVTDEEIAKYYQDNKSKFVNPRQVKLRYLELSVDDLRSGIDVSDAQLHDLYNKEKDRLAGSEQRRARHILIKVAPDASPEQVAKAKAKAEALVKQLRNGADFAKLAKQDSDDPGSASEGGDLGYFGKGAMDPDFEKAVFSLKQDEISDPVRTSYGFHIIQVTGIKTPKVPSFDEVRDKLYKQLTQDAAEQKFYDTVDRLSQLTFETPDSLQPAADALGLKVKESDWISEKGGPGIGQYENVVAAAFSDDVLDARNNSQAIEIGHNHMVVVRVAEFKPSTPIPEATVKPQIRDQLKQKKAREAAAEAGAALLTKLKAGAATLESLAQDSKYKLDTPGLIGRSVPKLDQEVVQEAFQLPRRSDGKPEYAGVATAKGDYILLRVDKIVDGTADTMKDADRESFQRGLDRMYGTFEAQAVLDQLKAAASIETNEKAIE